jgi:hypothetical protein
MITHHWELLSFKTPLSKFELNAMILEHCRIA